MPAEGKVFLVGAGPGDPGLITAKGLQCLRKSDVVVHDRLIGRELLDEARPGAELIDVGKAPGNVSMSQSDISALLVRLGEEGKIVCRLKGGDPFIFGRGGEEALALAEHRVPWEVVPGITSAIGALAYAGIPATHRGVATSFTVVTGSEDPDKPNSQTNWDAIASSSGTLIFLMGWTTLDRIVARLIQGGVPADRPTALVQWGTTRRQRVVTGPIMDIQALGQRAGITSPVAFVVGDVARLRERLAWFDNRPLFGKRILVTRARSQASRLRALLEARGAECIEAPVLETRFPEDPSALDALLRHAADYAWITVASANGSKSLRARMDALGLDARCLAGVNVAAVGAATAEALRSELGIRPDLVPEEYVSEGLVRAFQHVPIQGRRVAVLKSNLGRDVIGTGLRELGAEVHEIVAYETRPPEGASAADAVRNALKSGIDIATFTSSSGVDNLLNLVGDDTTALDGVKLACMGPITAGRASERGLTVDVVAPTQTMDALVQAIEDHLS